MSYYILKERDNRWQPRPGLEGPYFFANGQVLYYDVKEGQYYDPTTDFYVDNTEVALLHQQLISILSR